MTKIVFALLAISLFCTVSTAQAERISVRVEMECSSNKVMKSMLKYKYNEIVAARGVVISGELLLLYTSPGNTPSWTIVVRFRNDLTCIMAGGNEWESLSIRINGG